MSSGKRTASPRQVAEKQQADFLARLGSKLSRITREIATIDRRLSPLKDRRAVLASERDRLRKMMYETPTFQNRTGAGQGLYVHTTHFMPQVNEWIENYNTEHGKGGQQVLARKASISAKNIRSYNNGTITYAGMVTVDRILTAIDRHDIFDSLPFKTAVEIKLGHGMIRDIPQPPPTQYYED